MSSKGRPTLGCAASNKTRYERPRCQVFELGYTIIRPVWVRSDAWNSRAHRRICRLRYCVGKLRNLHICRTRNNRGIESMEIDGQPHRKPVRHFRTQRPNVSPMEVDTPVISGSASVQVPQFSHTISQSAYSPVRSTVPSVATNPHRPNDCVSQFEHLASRPLVSGFVTGSTSATHHPGYGTTRPPPSPVAIHSSATPHVASGTTHSPSVMGSSESFSPCVVQPSLGGGQQHPSVRAKRSAEFDAGDDVKSKKNRYEYSFKMEGELCSFQLQVKDDSGIVGISELVKKFVEYDKALSMKLKLKESFDTDGVCLLCKATQKMLKI